MAKSSQKFYNVIRDTREKTGFWDFAANTNWCAGTLVEKLDTGDYSIQGMESVFTIERKASTNEFASNLLELKRFEAELDRLDAFKYPFMILEFTIDDIINFPENSGIPRYLWGKLRVTNNFMLKKFLEYQCQHKTHIILAGQHGKRVAASLLKRMVEDVI